MKNKKVIIGIGTLISVLIIGLIIFKFSMSNNYSKNFKKATEAIVYNTSTDINTLKLYSQVLELSYFKNTDFESTLKSLDSTDSTTLKNSLDKSKQKNKEITKLMKKLKSPPKKYERDYDELLKMYDAYLKVHSKAQYCTTFSVEDYSDAADKLEEITDSAAKLKNIAME
ncbi:hypothetical protein LAV60_16895 [Clostridium sporogenes]|uniref:hypothetical protein n=1 Tax=Clostridium sporogenes TaxID=1509 RepID=UPI0013CF645F|nr:hypothetical protein [Clostridium sporogenes]MCW6094849.1 hypothetical protein [Clostridium sporogenes]NFG95558.1 hypothetical protein [Clostridium sporogenes]NFH31547.1 hypothetical protein [Clostridium sporogenes]NFL18953.1 hypothetical protein [Clostridium sporogenes]NFN71955.1 hypothetical protein [Clostridium sporogenes]